MCQFQFHRDKILDKNQTCYFFLRWQKRKNHLRNTFWFFNILYPLQVICETKNYQCDFCKSWFEKARAVSDHRKLECCVCRKSLLDLNLHRQNRTEAMLRHLQRYHKSANCTVCEGHFGSEYEKMKHYLNPKDYSKYTCCICGDTDREFIIKYARLLFSMRCASIRTIWFRNLFKPWKAKIRLDIFVSL